MSLRRRLRIVWAALTQEWHLHTCKCGQTQWVEGRHTWSDQSMCVPCEERQFEQWMAHHGHKGVA